MTIKDGNLSTTKEQKKWHEIYVILANLYTIASLNSLFICENIFYFYFSKYVFLLTW